MMLVIAVCTLFTLLTILQWYVDRHPRFICHYTSKSFVPKDVREMGNGFAWVACEVCDANGKVIGETGYNRNQPAQHVIKTKTADAVNVNRFVD